MKTICAIFLSLFLSATAFPANPLHTSYSGTINKTLKIKMKLNFEDKKIAGSYFYEKNKTEIPLKGSIDDLDHFEIQEYDSKGNVTGVFRGEHTGILELEGDWSKPGSDRKMPFVLKADPVFGNGKSAGWAGTWNYVKTTQFDRCSIDIGNEQPERFDFEIAAESGGNAGSMEGTARIAGTKALWTDNETGCKVKMTLKGQSLYLETTEECQEFAGNGVQFFNDEYRQGEIKDKGLVELGVFGAAQDKILRQLTGADYQQFVDSMQLISEVQDLDKLGVKGVSGGVRGLFTEMEGIVLYRPDGKMWAAVIDSDSGGVKYFTNDPAWAKKLPKSIDQWRTNFADKEIIYMSAKK